MVQSSCCSRNTWREILLTALDSVQGGEAIGSWTAARSGRRRGTTTALFIACRNSHVDAAQLLLDKGAALIGRTRKGETPLHHAACQNGHVDVARLLRGADVDRANQTVQTPLWIACQEGHVDAVRLLLDKGAAVDRARKDGRRRCSSPAGRATSTRCGCCWRKARTLIGRRRTAQRRCSSPAGTATSTRRDCC